jgi:hypothetical protein
MPAEGSRFSELWTPNFELQITPFSHIPLLSQFAPVAPVAQTAPHGLTLPPAFCRMSA